MSAWHGSLRWATIGVLLALPPSAGGEQLPEFLTAIPESPAFSLLGATPAQVARPASARDFGLALINGVGANGKIVNGFAIEASLWRMIPNSRLPLEEYQQSRLKYLLANTQISLATTAREGDVPATDLGIGGKVTLLDRGDPMADPQFTGEIGSALLDCLPASPEPSEEKKKLQIECIDDLIAQRWDEFARERWNAARLSLAVASSWTFEDSDLDRMENLGLRVWLTGALPLGNRGMAIGQVEFRDQSALGELPSADSLSAGARVIFGSAGVNGFVEFIAEEVSTGTMDEDRTSWSIGADVRVAANIWVSGGFGRRFESLLEADTEAKTAVLANLKWGVTSKSRIDTLK